MKEHIEAIRRQLRNTPRREIDRRGGTPPPLPAPPVPRPQIRVLGITGHRPNRMGDEPWLAEVLHRLVAKLEYQRGLSGMAWGADLLFCEACRDMGVAYDAIIPYPQQPDRWPLEWQARYREAVGLAQETQVLQPEYSAGVYMKRNRMLVNRVSDVLVVWDGVREGGTWATVQMIEQKGMEWVWIHPEERTVKRRRSPLQSR